MTRPITLLVEGESDKALVEALAPRYGVDLDDLGIEVVSMNGAGNAARYIRETTATGHRVGGLYDEAEEHFVTNALGRQVGEDLSGQGFFACRRDLEEEMIRAIGAARIVEILEANGEGGKFRTLQNQPEHRGEEVADQLHRFFGTASGRKIRYGTILGEAVELEHIPEPLVGLLTWCWG